jgi:DNA-binding NarL/FixJ family response regulator
MIERITRALDPESFAKAVEEGSRLATAEYLALVDRITAPAPHDAAPPSPPAGRAPAPHGKLTARELEVLRLVAQGLTNAQVARALTVTPRTINAHLTSIYGKLDVTSRAGAIRYALERHLS